MFRRGSDVGEEGGEEEERWERYARAGGGIGLEARQRRGHIIAGALFEGDAFFGCWWSSQAVVWRLHVGYRARMCEHWMLIVTAYLRVRDVSCGIKVSCCQSRCEYIDCWDTKHEEGANQTRVTSTAITLQTFKTWDIDNMEPIDWWQTADSGIIIYCRHGTSQELPPGQMIGKHCICNRQQSNTYKHINTNA